MGKMFHMKSHSYCTALYCTSENFFKSVHMNSNVKFCQPVFNIALRLLFTYQLNIREKFFEQKICFIFSTFVKIFYALTNILQVML